MAEQSSQGHNGQCEGELIQINKDPVRAGDEPGAVYFIYQCPSCGNMLPVGGKEFIID